MTFKQKKFSVYKNISVFGSYLAGLWEGNGHISARNQGAPSFHITFNIKEKPLALKLGGRLRALGARCTFQEERKDNTYVLNIYRSLEIMVNLMNGRLRTPKQYRVKAAVDAYNKKKGTNIILLPTIGPLENDAWFTGFADADGNFLIRCTKGDLRSGTKRSIACRFRLKQRMMDPKTQESYKPILDQIASFCRIRLNTLTQKYSGREYFSIDLQSAKSKAALRAYFGRFPLLSSKYLDYKDWCAVDDLIIAKTQFSSIPKVIKHKQSMNLNRHEFCWDHLDLF